MDQTDRNVEILRQRMQAKKAELCKDLAAWVCRATGPVPAICDPRDAQFCGPYVEITDALLETGMDRMLALLHDGQEAREFLLKTFDRQLAAYKRSLQ